MKVRFEDVEFTKCCEYDPFSSRANSYGVATFWRADIRVGFANYISCTAHTKAECAKEARRMVSEINAK